MAAAIVLSTMSHASPRYDLLANGSIQQQFQAPDQARQVHSHQARPVRDRFEQVSRV